MDVLSITDLAGARSGMKPGCDSFVRPDLESNNCAPVSVSRPASTASAARPSIGLSLRHHRARRAVPKLAVLLNLALRVDAARDGRVRKCRSPSTRCLHRKKWLQRQTQRFRIVTSQRFVRYLSLPATPCRLSRSSLDQAEVCVLVRRTRGFCRSTPNSTSCCSIGPAGRSVRTSAGQSRTTWLRSSTGWGSIDRIG